MIRRLWRILFSPSYGLISAVNNPNPHGKEPKIWKKVYLKDEDTGSIQRYMFIDKELNKAAERSAEYEKIFRGEETPDCD